MTISQTGDIWTIGDHRLACGDSSDANLIASLMQDQSADLVFTSPPYTNLRTYLTYNDSKWDQMMQSVFDAIPAHDRTQIIVNLGLVHKHHAVLWYWQDWLGHMKRTGWRNTGLYVWDKLNGMCGDHKGRLAPAFEFLFHFNKFARRPNKVKAKKAENIKHRLDSTMRKKDGTIRPASSPHTSLNTHKIPDSVIRTHKELSNRPTKFGSHPAVFPIKLPMELIEAYTDEHQIVFDPFGGSGTTIIAAHRLNRSGYGVEIEPAYCDLALDRIQRETRLTAYRQDGENFDHLTDDFFASSRSGIVGIRSATDDDPRRFGTAHTPERKPYQGYVAIAQRGQPDQVKA